ncbi:outer membrane beta-barrel protein [Marinilabilia salmonicolor]|uniref:Uncharacterized protein n=1 Tax=Marinilabilia salmonicolor TaxID=989 RepID=A0A368VCN5_9BACT|nr:outer membrane beta-barrel protein [Marinilabilia salmonicolor]RCW38959.1 hypothetical protein DFO77_102113 [Marinilabilia salmonicolor]
MDFLKWYKNTVNSGKEEPPRYAWEDIQNDLDIDLVYERLEKSLQKDRRKIWIWRASSAAGILLLLSVGTILLNRFRQTATEQHVAIHSSPTGQDLPQQSSLELLLPQPEIDSLEKISHPLILPEEYQQRVLKTSADQKNIIAELQTEPVIENLKVHPDSLLLNSPFPGILLTENSLDIRTNSDRLSPMSFSIPEAKIMIEHESPLAHIELPEQESFVPAKNTKTPLLSRFTIFAVGELANTWLISPKTKEAFDPQEFTANQTTIKQNYGIGISGNITERWEIIGQFSLARQNGQHYKEYYQGKYVSNNIDLEYTDIVLKARYRPFKRDENHAVSAGFYTAFLNNAHQLISDVKTDVSSDYTENDFGLVAGYQYFAPVTDKITLAAGAFYRQGLKNIFAGNNLIPKNLNQSTNTSFNFTLSVGYTFSL